MANEPAEQKVLVVVEVRVLEFIDGHQAQEFKMRQEGGIHDDYVGVVKRLVDAIGGPRRCADGSLVHDFKGQSSCPSCGISGLEV